MSVNQEKECFKNNVSTSFSFYIQGVNFLPRIQTNSFKVKCSPYCHKSLPFFAQERKQLIQDIALGKKIYFLQKYYSSLLENNQYIK